TDHCLVAALCAAQTPMLRDPTAATPCEAITCEATPIRPPCFRSPSSKCLLPSRKRWASAHEWTLALGALARCHRLSTCGIGALAGAPHVALDGARRGDCGDRARHSCRRRGISA